MKAYLEAEVDKRIAKCRSFFAHKQSWNKASSYKVLFITEDSRIPHSQIYPFYYYQKSFERRWNVEFRELNVNAFEQSKTADFGEVQCIILQPWFDKGDQRICQMLSRLKESNPQAKIVFFDSFAHTDLRFAESINEHIDWYVKKHVFKHRADYNKPTLGDTSLVDYYNQCYHLEQLAPVFFKVPPTFFDKLKVGPSFFTTPEMLADFHHFSTPRSLPKRIDIHARLGAKGTPWYQTMREQALKVALSVPSNNSVITASGVSGRKYMQELRSARICFSPFGYGEMCWRDYEAVYSGALLVKPDISHLELSPDSFLPDQSYVAVAWDFSDLAEKIAYYLNHDELRTEIALNAYRIIHEYVIQERFLDDFSFLFE